MKYSSDKNNIPSNVPLPFMVNMVNFNPNMITHKPLEIKAKPAASPLIPVNESKPQKNEEEIKFTLNQPMGVGWEGIAGTLKKIARMPVGDKKDIKQ